MNTTRREEPLVCLWLVKAHLLGALIAACVSTLAGYAYSLQFLNAYPFEDIELLSPGRVRMVHTHLIAYGFVVNGFVGGIYYALPRLCGVRMASIFFGKCGFWFWQFVLAATTIGILTGHAQGIEWGETPTGFRTGEWGLDALNFIPIDLLVVLSMPTMIYQFYYPIWKARNSKHIYVTQWYLTVGFAWLPLTYLMGNVFPEYFNAMAGASGQAMAGLYIHDLVGLLITPFGWGLMYFFVPVILKKPIWSHWLSVIGFWSLAFFYPLNGVHHFLLSPIPDFVEFGAIIATVGVEVVVVTVVANFFVTMYGRGQALRTNLPIRWFYVGMVFYALTCLQCAWQVTWTAQEIIHFTDWVVGHAHMVMFGVFGHWVIGISVYVWPRITGREWWSRSLLHWHFWLSMIGVAVMFVALTISGLIVGYEQMNLVPWLQMVSDSRPFWIVRSLSGLAIVNGLLLHLFNMVATMYWGAPYDPQVDELKLEDNQSLAAQA